MNEFCSEFERKPYTPFFTCKRCGQRRYDEPVICLKQPTQFEKSLKQRQEVWGYFKSGAPGITVDGPYVLDKRDVWYMRLADEQHAGYAWQERGKTFIPVDLCYVCNELADIEVLNECPVCFAFVCCDCSCGCNEPGYQENDLDFNPADPRNDKEWVERECKKIIDLAQRYAAPPEIIRTQAERNYIDACEKAIVACRKCKKVYHIPQPEPGTIFAMDFTCDCGHPISLRTKTGRHQGTMHGHTMQLTNYQREVLDSLKMKNDLRYFAEKHRAPLVPTPAQLYMMKTIMEQYEKTGKVEVRIIKR